MVDVRAAHIFIRFKMDEQPGGHLPLYQQATGHYAWVCNIWKKIGSNYARNAGSSESKLILRSKMGETTGGSCNIFTLLTCSWQNFASPTERLRIYQ